MVLDWQTDRYPAFSYWNKYRVQSGTSQQPTIQQKSPVLSSAVRLIEISVFSRKIWVQKGNKQPNKKPKYGQEESIDKQTHKQDNYLQQFYNIFKHIFKDVPASAQRQR